jgi:apolipoprotein N-acyltransferase
MPRTRALPPPLPPEERTVGQLVGEAMRAFGNRFWAALAIGVPVAGVNALVWVAPDGPERLVVAAASGVLISLSYVGACVIVLERPLRRRESLVAYAIGVLVFLPFPFLAAVFVLPGLVWLAFVGLAVPAAFVEGLRPFAALRRGIDLARVDFIHVLGGLATLALVVFLTQAALYLVLRQYAENTRAVAAILASIVVSPLVFIGAALLYVDQEARLRSRSERREERDAHLPDAVHAHRKGRANPARKSRPSP